MRMAYDGLAAAKKTLAENVFIRSHGMELVRLDAEECVGKMPFLTEHKNHLGHMHGGVSFAFADVIAGTLAHASGRAMTTTGGEIHYLRGIKDIDEILCTARVIKRGKTLSVFEARITDVSGERLFATGIFTYYALDYTL